MKFVCRFSIQISLVLILLAACGDSKDAQQTSEATPSITFSITSGSENKQLEPLIQDFARKEGAVITVTYQGSVDMTLMLAEQGGAIPFDAVWPANSLWISLGDTQKVVKNSESIMRSPVILGVKKSVAERLGWLNQPVTIAGILSAAESGQLRFAMTSATQSNSGASAYLGFLHAMAGSPDVLQLEHLENPTVREKVKALLAMVDRSSGSSGWLKDMLVAHPERFQAMINYEAMLIEANQELVRRGKEPLFAVYPADGIMIADSPLGYIDKGDPAKAALFKKLQAYLLSDDVQNAILKQGRRTGLVGMNLSGIDKTVFNPDWGIDVEKIISPVPTPSEPVIRRALELYQVALRKPSCTAYVVDVSGSMKGEGLRDLKAALFTLFDPDQARRYMLQPSPEDIHIIIPFNSAPLAGLRVTGNSTEMMNQVISFVNRLSAGGGTNIYAATAQGLVAIGDIPDIQNYFPAVILMTDGRSKGGIDMLRAAMDRLPMGNDIPIFSITFGDADERQLIEISDLSIGRLFPGKNLVKAFRTAKGYN